MWRRLVGCLFLLAFTAFLESERLLAQTEIVIETELGPMEAILDDSKAPATVRNFLQYVDQGRYAGGRFHRTVRTNPDNQPLSAVKIDVIQGGVAPEFQGHDFPPIALERSNITALRHTDGSLSMARGAPDSATSDFFICVGDQPELDFGGKRNPDGQGFAVFGLVVSGMDVVRAIHRSPAGPSESEEKVAAGNQRLSPPIRILRIRRK